MSTVSNLEKGIACLPFVGPITSTYSMGKFCFELVHKMPSDLKILIMERTEETALERKSLLDFYKVNLPFLEDVRVCSLCGMVGNVLSVAAMVALVAFGIIKSIPVVIGFSAFAMAHGYLFYLVHWGVNNEIEQASMAAPDGNGEFVPIAE